MRKLMMLAAPAALLATPALAQDATGTVAVDGSVAGRCLFTTSGATISLGELALTGTGATAGKLDPAKVSAGTATLAGWCNHTAARMTVRATELTGPTGSAPGFDKRIDYTATATANGTSATDSSLDVAAGSSANVGMFAGDVVVTLSDASTPTGGRLVAGSYTGDVTVTLAPNFVFETSAPEL